MPGNGLVKANGKPTLEEIQRFIDIYTQTNNFAEAAYAIGRSAWEMEAFFEADSQAKVLLEEARHKLRGYVKSKLWELVEAGKIGAIKLALQELDPKNYGNQREVTVRHTIELDDETKEALRSLPRKSVRILPKPQREEVEAEIVDE